MISIPDDLAYDVARALEREAEIYRADKGHDPEDIVTLMADADRLDELAAEIDERLARMEADRKSAKWRPEP